MRKFKTQREKESSDYSKVNVDIIVDDINISSP